VIARAGAGGFTLREVTDALQQHLDQGEPRKRTK
jgi:hypothetical protein